MPGLLVIRGGAVGDFVLTLPVLRLLRETFPTRQIDLLAQPAVARLALELGLVDAVHSLESAGLARFFSSHAPPDAGWSEYFSGFDVIISYLADPDETFHTNLARVGKANVLRGIPKPVDAAGHATLQLARPLEALGLVLADSDWKRPFRRGPPSTTGPIALHPGSGSPGKNWGFENWCAVARALHRARDAEFLIVSGEAEAATIEQFCSMMRNHRVPFARADQLPLETLFGQLGGCRLFLGHDTGPAHVAAAAGVPCLLLFGPTDPAVWAPPGPHVTVMRAPDGVLAALKPQEVIEAAIMRGLPP